MLEFFSNTIHLRNKNIQLEKIVNKINGIKIKLKVKELFITVLKSEQIKKIEQIPIAIIKIIKKFFPKKLDVFN